MLGLLPLNRARWLGRDIICHAVNPFHFINDTGRDMGQEVMTKRVDIGGHAIG